MKKFLSLITHLLISIIIISPSMAQTDAKQVSDISKVHLKVIIDDGGQKSSFEKTYQDINALAKDKQLDSLGINMQTINADLISISYEDSLHKNADKDKKIIIVSNKKGEPSDSTITHVWVEKSSSKHEIHKGKNKTITIIAEEDVNKNVDDKSSESEEKIIIDGDSNYTITIEKDKSNEKMKVIVKDDDSDKNTTINEEEINQEINVTVDENGEKNIEIRIKKEKTN